MFKSALFYLTHLVLVDPNPSSNLKIHTCTSGGECSCTGRGGRCTSCTSTSPFLLIDSCLEDDGPVGAELPRGHHHLALLGLGDEICPLHFPPYDAFRYLVVKDFLVLRP